MTKTQLAELVLKPEELKNFDIAIPKQFSDVLRDLGIEENVIRNFVWVYVPGNFTGNPTNLLDRAYQKYYPIVESLDLIKEEVRDFIRSVGAKSAEEFFPNFLNAMDKIHDADSIDMEKLRKRIQEEVLDVPPPDKAPFNQIGEDLYKAAFCKLIENKGISKLIQENPSLEETIRLQMHDEVMDYCELLIRNS